LQTVQSGFQLSGFVSGHICNPEIDARLGISAFVASPTHSGYFKDINVMVWLEAGLHRYLLVYANRRNL
jgi:hypothetical protein